MILTHSPVKLFGFCHYHICMYRAFGVWIEISEHIYIIFIKEPGVYYFSGFDVIICFIVCFVKMRVQCHVQVSFQDPEFTVLLFDFNIKLFEVVKVVTIGGINCYYIINCGIWSYYIKLVCVVGVNSFEVSCSKTTIL